MAPEERHGYEKKAAKVHGVKPAFSLPVRDTELDYHMVSSVILLQVKLVGSKNHNWSDLIYFCFINISAIIELLLSFK